MKKQLQEFYFLATAWWYKKDEKQRKKTSRNLGLAVFLVVLVVYFNWNKTDQELNVIPEKTTEMPLTSEDSAMMLEKDISEAAAMDLEAARNETIEEVDLRIEEFVAGLENNSSFNSNNQQEENSDYVGSDYQNNGLPEGVTLPPPANNDGSKIATNVQNVPQPTPKWVWAGGVVKTGGASKEDYKKISDTTVVPDQREIDLPVGFMKATLLVGINARSGEYGQSNPQQIVFLVKAPAQLPNKIKLNLKGCFAVANAHGDLSAKRIEALPVSINCLTKDGKQKITSSRLTGFVQDKDGKRGLDARVVSRARHLLAATLFAKTVTGMGEVIASQGQTTSKTVFGSVSTPTNSEVAKTALAKGLGEGVGDIGDYLLDLAKQMQPTLEHGAGKDVLLWIAEPSVMTIEELKQ